ncbi:adenylyl-sulfate kinase [Rubellicoccus peritrichatus]|uniref:Adenylyl-sulfate kinase n=1 Tax=Rubellicoccus peritrichatus TaxID=3080537 RepID=A0AAQ3QVY9_9BACT|nr:adenylyl-sulfate kinase [Puniceicoccus sp. CR14]WOO42108.1 adenylyl-sulfate kinase [Puniceicoccus sp. CR14]
MASADNIYPEFKRMLPRSSREEQLGQRGHVFWLYGLSGSGKSTLAIALERQLHQQGLHCQLLDGDNIRSGLNADLGFSDEDRKENIRRIAEVAKLFAHAGVVTLTAFICPKKELRSMAREIIGKDDFTDVYVKASYETCQARDPKGLYQKVNAGQVKHFTGKDSGFEEPASPDVLIDTETLSLEASINQLLPLVLTKVKES